ncbi:DUF6602 domain-containing protein [Pedobacter borealis]|uniref:DUF6602 domain-containing protein n=1 Tax=Pedobacter borealis TaxID=475254 RepID=UPI000AD7F50D|nr:DUF6602 domain-containing protein [Pedobacter borealis]
MQDNFQFISEELLLKLNQAKGFITRHHPTIGIVTEEILRSFLKEHLPKTISVEQGFIRNADGETSRQIDIIIYDSSFFAPFYRINDIVIVPTESVVAIVEVKTSMDNARFHDALDYFKEVKKICYKPCHLFIYNAPNIASISGYFDSYRAKHGPYTYDHDTFQLLPDEITGIKESYHLKQDYVDAGRDTYGYSCFEYKNSEGTEINALQHFYLSIYNTVENYIAAAHVFKHTVSRDDYFKKEFSQYFAFSLFDT